MRICTIANGDCFKELGLSDRDDSINYYGGSISPTREVFDVIRKSAENSMLAVSYGDRKQYEEVNGYRMLLVPITPGRASIFSRLRARLFSNIIPIFRGLLDFQPDYVLSIDGWTFRHLIPLVYCFLSSSRMIPVITAQYDGCTGEGRLKRFLVRLLLSSSNLDQIQAFGARSEAVASQLRKAGVNSDKLRVLYPYFGKYASERSEGRKQRSDQPFSVLFVGRFVEEKNPTFFVKLASEVVNNRSSSEIQFSMIGDGPLMPSIRKIVSARGLSSVVCLRGYQNSKETFLSLSESDLLVITSTCESFGKVAVESLIAGTPVIASAVGGLVDIIADGENGFLCEAGNLIEFADRITSLYANRGLYTELIDGVSDHADYWISKGSSIGEFIEELCGGIE